MSTHPSRRAFLQSSAAAGLLAQADATKAKDVPLAPPDKQPPDLKLPDPPPRKLGWALVGIGQLTVEELLPAFLVARRSRLVALVSGHPDKAKKVAAACGVEPKNIYTYDTFDKLADNPAVDIVYIVLPNSLHAEYTIRAHKAGKHVLCEKPMAASVAECEKMIAAAKAARKKLMIAYRLHYEPFNLLAMSMMRKKELGQAHSISSSNCQNVKAPNIRLSKQLAGGPVEDIGVYLINAARYLTGEEPAEVTAMAHHPRGDPRFREVPGSVAFSLRFPGGVIASCDCSFATDESRFYEVHAAKGVLRLDPAFSYRGLRMSVKRGVRHEELRLPEVNQFAEEMDHLSMCVAEDRRPRTPGEEGLADLRVIEAIAEAAKGGKAVRLRR